VAWVLLYRVNGVAIALLLGLFGVGPTVLYVSAGLVIAVVAGLVLERIRPERWIEPFAFETRLRGQVVDTTAGLTWDDRIEMGVEEVGSILRRIWPYLLVGIGVIIKILGPGCANCATLEKATREAVAELGLDASIESDELRRDHELRDPADARARGRRRRRPSPGACRPPRRSRRSSPRPGSRRPRRSPAGHLSFVRRPYARASAAPPGARRTRRAR
jgi:hypothetical protein